MNRVIEAIWRGALNRCPNCGKGRIFSTLTRMQPTCSECGVTFQPYEGDFLGAVAIAYTITAVAGLVGYLLLRPWVHWTSAAEIVFWGAFCTVFYIGFYPNMKGIWVGILYLMTGLKPRL